MQNKITTLVFYYRFTFIKTFLMHFKVKIYIIYNSFPSFSTLDVTL